MLIKPTIPAGGWVYDSENKAKLSQVQISWGLAELGNKLLDALGLPVFTVYNMRSIWPKLNSLAEDIVERSADISFLSEVWSNLSRKLILTFMFKNIFKEAENNH